jgi:predicted nucleotidyltransferase
VTNETQNPFPTITKLAKECGASWKMYNRVAESTCSKEFELLRVLGKGVDDNRVLSSDTALVVFGSFARYELVGGSDCDWAILVDGVVDVDHAKIARKIDSAIKEVTLKEPGTTGTFGSLVFSHDLVHCIGGQSDSNANTTRRILMLLESRCLSLSQADQSAAVWSNVIKNISKRYFEEDVHFTPQGSRSVPRFLLNDITRYWRTMCVDYAAKYREQDGKKWALRNAKLRFSRKLLYATGLAFCLSCELDPPENVGTNLFGFDHGESVQPFLRKAESFAQTVPLEYLAAFVNVYVQNPDRRVRISKAIFDSYNDWLALLDDEVSRDELTNLQHDSAHDSDCFRKVRDLSKQFAAGLCDLFFNREANTEQDAIAKLSLDYVGF